MSAQFPENGGGMPAGFTKGSVVAGYRLEEQVGAGGMAVVFRARDERLGRMVALKLLAPALASDIAFRRRFVGESRSAAAVDDPHIIPVYEAGEASGVLFIAMRFVRGGDVRSLVHLEGPLASAKVAAIISPIASALDAAHAAGLVHRDVKPANMLLDTRPGRPDHVYLSDFGLSKGAMSSAGLTGTGQFMGTPNYVAPEQIEGGRTVDGRVDQYALACAAFEMLTGTAPFEREQGMAVIWAHLSEPPPSVSARRPGLDPRADEVFARALAKKPEARFGSCQEFADALRGSLGLAPYDSGPGAVPPPAPDETAETAAATPAPDTPTPTIAAAAAHATAPPVAVAVTPPGLDAETPPGPTAAKPPGSAASTPPAPTAITPPAPAVVTVAGTTPTVTRDAQTRLAAEPGSQSPAVIGVPMAPQPGSSRGRVWLAAGVGAVVLVTAAVTAIALSGSTASHHGHGTPTRSASHSAAPPTGLLATAHVPGFSPAGTAFSTGGTALAALAPDGSVTVWNTDGFRRIAKVSDSQSTGPFGGLAPNGVAFSPDGKQVAAGDQNGHAFVWDVPTGHLISKVTDLNTLTGVYAVAFGPGGTMLATGDGSGVTYIWNAASGSRISTGRTSGGGQTAAAVAFSPNGATIAVGDDAGVTSLWSIPGGVRIRAMTDPNTSGVDAVAFSSSGAELAVADSNGNTYVWDAATGKLVFTLANPNSVANGGVTALGFSQDGTILATGDSNGTVCLWRVSTGTKIGSVTDPSGAAVAAVAVTATDKHVQVSDTEGVSYLWQVPS